MLRMEQDRLDFAEALMPDPGFEALRVVGTTYTLDMRALLGTCLALVGDAPTGKVGEGDAVGIFASFTKLRGRLAVFCEKGRIKNEEATGRLSVLLEDFVNQVVVSKPKSLGATSIATFHPKVWVAEYRNTKTRERTYRLLVMSRNLTLDGSWDLAVRLDGRPTGRAVEESASVCAFLDYLAGSTNIDADAKTRKMVRELSKSVSKVRFEVDQHVFEDFEFLPIGPAHTRRYGMLDAMQTDLMTQTVDTALIISPFLGSGGPLRALVKNRSWREATGPATFHLMSRAFSLDGLDPKLREQYTCYAPRPWLSEVEVEDEGEDEGTGAAAYSDIHAKAYVTERYADRSLYIGSLNASRNGAFNNVEALLRLRIRKGCSGMVDRFVAELAGEKCPFEKYVPTAVPEGGEGEVPFVQTSRYRDLERSFHAAAKLLEFVDVRAGVGDDGSYQMGVSCSLTLPEACDEGLSFVLAPYLEPKEKAVLPVGKSELAFIGLTLDQVSRFFVFRTSGIDPQSNERFSMDCVVCCPEKCFDDGLEPDERVRAVLDGMLRRRTNLLPEYVARVFGIKELAGGGGDGDGPGRHTVGTTTVLGSGIYEVLLKSISSADDAKERLEYAKLMLSYLPTDMEADRVQAMRDLIDTFQKAVR